MKKFVFCLLVFNIVFSTSLLSQEVASSMFLSSPAKKTIVREHPSWGYISYIETSAEHVFVLTKPSMDNYYAVQIPLNIFVNDIEIYREKVFFCGYDTATPPNPQGVLGYFRIDSLCFFGNNIYINNSFYYNPPISRVTEFTEMEVFDEYQQNQQLAGDSVFIALIGINKNKKPVVVEAIGAYNSPNSWRYALGLNNLNNTTETYDQISVTDNYIVLGGTYLDRLNGVSFRFFDRHGPYDMFAASSLYNTVYWYPSITPQTSNTIEYPIRKFEMTAMDNDRVATLSLYKKYTSGVPPALLGGFLLNVYSIQQTISGGVANCLYSVVDAPSHNYYYSGQAQVKDLRYDNVTGNFYALLKAYVSNATTYFDEHVCAVVPYMQPLPSSFVYYYLTGIDLDRVVLCNSASQCLLSGRVPSIGSIVYYKNSVVPTFNCSTKGWRQCTAPMSFLCRYASEPINNIFRQTFNFSSINVTCTMYNTHVNCSSSKSPDVEK